MDFFFFSNFLLFFHFLIKQFRKRGHSWPGLLPQLTQFSLFLLGLSLLPWDRQFCWALLEIPLQLKPSVSLVICRPSSNYWLWTEAGKPCVLLMAEGSQNNNLTRRKEEVGAVFWELRDVDSDLLRNELWVPRNVWQGGSVAALVLRSHWKDCDIACFWNEGFIQLWKRILGREPWMETHLLAALC